jgi:hypothetical protein
VNRNSLPDLGQAPTFADRRDIALVAIAVGAIAGASVIFSLVDVASTKSDAQIMPASDAQIVRAQEITTEAGTSTSPTAEGDQAATPQSPTTTLSVREPVAAPPEPPPTPGEAAQKSDVSSDHEWRRGDRQRRSRGVYWQSAHTRLLSQGSISSER